MKELIIKADRMVLNVLTRHIQKWVEKREYKKHKIDFLIRAEWLQFALLIVWAIVGPAALYLMQGQLLGAVIHTFFWSMLAVFEWFGIQQTTYKTKPTYDFLFSLRGEPGYNKMHAETLEEMFVENRQSRIEGHAMIFGITAVLFVIASLATRDAPDAMVWQYLVVNAIANRLKIYIGYVNDFDEPKKKKKASESISELVQRLWGDFIGGLTPPQPAFQRITQKINS